jgi:hypothetical protein
MTHVEAWPPATRQGLLVPTQGNGLAPRHDSWVLGDEPRPEPVAEPKVSLSALVRRWMVANDDLKLRGREQDGPSPEASRPDVAAAPAPDPALVAPESTVEYPDEEQPVEPEGDVDETDPEGVVRIALPRRRRGRTQPQLARRLAVLIDARAVTTESTDQVFDALADHGSVNVARAYGDWSSPEGQDLMPRLRHHGIQPCHQFAQGHDQRSLVAMAVDAVDLARDGAVDVVALVGDLASVYPLVQRLNAAGVAVMAFGPADSPDDVRGMCEEFTDLELLEPVAAVTGGRHRA